MVRGRDVEGKCAKMGKWRRKGSTHMKGEGVRLVWGGEYRKERSSSHKVKPWKTDEGELSSIGKKSERWWEREGIPDSAYKLLTGEEQKAPMARR